MLPRRRTVWRLSLPVVLVGSGVACDAARVAGDGVRVDAGVPDATAGTGGAGAGGAGTGGTGADPGTGGVPARDAASDAPAGAASDGAPNGVAGDATTDGGHDAADAERAPEDASLDGPPPEGGPRDAALPDPPPDVVTPPPVYEPEPPLRSCAGPTFTDVTVAAGLAIVQGPSIPSTGCRVDDVVPCGPSFTGGGAAADYDGDGRPDLYLTRVGSPGVLLHNRGDGTFEDVTRAAGLWVGVSSNGAAFADVDDDGDLDLYVTTIGTTRFLLFVNDGAGHFTEEGIARGVALAGSDVHQGQSVTFGDYDRDGYLDLHVNEWRAYAIAPGSNTRLLHNRGAAQPGYFEDVTDAAGVSMVGVHADGVWAFTSTFSDLDDDGWPDLAIAADFRSSRLFWNRGDGTFTDGTLAAGVGTDESGMGSATGDVDGDGRLDWFVTSIDCNDPLCPLFATGNRLYRGQGARAFADGTDAYGVRRARWAWGAALFDPDNDGDLDLVVTNGAVFPGDPRPLFETDRMRYFRNDGAGASPVMTELGRECGIEDRGQGRGLLVLDYDGDGDEDVLTLRNATTPILYRNDGGSSQGFLDVRLRGKGTSARGIGARVTITVAGKTRVREVTAGGQFLSQSDAVAHFGLGPGTDPVAEVRVRWPRSGLEQVLTAVARNQVLVIDEQ